MQTRLITLLFGKNKKFTKYIELQDGQFILLRRQPNWSIDKLTRILCLLLIGFLMGNVFGTFLNSIRKYVTWDGIILFFLIGFIEILNYTVYHTKNRPFLGAFIHSKIINKSVPLLAKISFAKTNAVQKQSLCKPGAKWLNFLKIGLMVGFFVDAFKVGS